MNKIEFVKILLELFAEYETLLMFKHDDNKPSLFGFVAYLEERYEQ